MSDERKDVHRIELDEHGGIKSITLSEPHRQVMAETLSRGEPVDGKPEVTDVDRKRAERFFRGLDHGAHWQNDLAELLARVRTEGWHKGHDAGWVSCWDEHVEPTLR